MDNVFGLGGVARGYVVNKEMIAVEEKGNAVLVASDSVPGELHRRACGARAAEVRK